MASTISILYTAPDTTVTDITADCEFATWHFASQMAATPGQFNGVVRDPLQTYGFVTGGEITAIIDGVALYGGYVLDVTMQFAFEVVDTSAGAAAVTTRQWNLSGSDYNYMLDKLVFHNSGDYFAAVTVPGPVWDSDLISTYLPNYLDMPPGFDFSSGVVPNFQFATDYTFSDGTNGQGFYVRAVINDLTQYGAVAYMGPDKVLRFRGVQDSAAPFGFSDIPDGVNFIGFREGSATEDLTPVGNDAFVWGGSAWADNGSLVFARQTNTGSVTAHNRWQVAEVKVGSLKIQSEVDARANVIVSGNTTGTTTDGQQGISQPEQRYNLTWFSDRAPQVDGIPQTIYPGDVVPIELWTFSTDGGVTPFTISVPCRSIDISFPGLDENGNPHVQFAGTFGLLVSDPEWMWAYLRRNLSFFRGNVTGGQYSTSGGGSSGGVPYGSLWNGSPSPAPDGSTTVFTIKDSAAVAHGYISGTTQVWLNGLSAVFGLDYTESDPAAGEITWISSGRTPLHTGDTLWVVCRLIG